MNEAAFLEANVKLVACNLRLMRSGVRDSTDANLQAEYESHLAQIESMRRAGDGCGPMSELSVRLGLSVAETALIWLAAAVRLAPEAREALRNDPTLGTPTGDINIDVARRYIYQDLGDPDAVRELSESGTLRRLRILERSDSAPPDCSDSRQTWALSTRVLGWLCGDRDASEALLSGTAWLPQGLPLLALELHPDTVARSNAALGTVDNVVVVVGTPSSGRRTLAAALAAETQNRVLEVDARKLPRDVARLASHARLVARECRLAGGVPLVSNVECHSEADADRVSAFASELVCELAGRIFVTSNAVPRRSWWGGRATVIELRAIGSSQRASVWQRELGQGTAQDAEYLAAQYPLAPALIHHASKAAKARANGRPLQPEDIYAGVRAVLDDKLGDYARRVEVTQTWDDLVLPDDQMEAVQYLIARIRQRRTVYEQWGFAAKVGKGLGTSALFSGPPGTGKTMVAALIAKELGLELYQVDMAKVVSKYIGETERNLAGLFDAAEAGHAILLFDEADSLFGKRTDVKSSNDRYANLETNYLLQRLESFTGICLLTSNHEANIDSAFQRRLSLHVRFELPEAEERASLWRAMLPAAAPVAAGVDFGTLARKYVMSGGYIRNAALRAAFLAADEGSPITAKHLECAARLEYECMGKIAA
jgi:AAA+ superfamily predicted ATPase